MTAKKYPIREGAFLTVCLLGTVGLFAFLGWKLCAAGHAWIGPVFFVVGLYLLWLLFIESSSLYYNVMRLWRHDSTEK